MKWSWISGVALFSVFANAQSSCSQCSSEQPTTSAPHKNIWAGLDTDEVSAVTTFLQSRRPDFNFVGLEEAGFSDNAILRMDLLQPNKSDVLPFLQEKAAAPARYARVGILFANVDEPYYQEYMVGPLPIKNSSTVQELKYPFNNQSPGKIQAPAPYLLGSNFTSFVLELVDDVSDITTALWNITFETGLKFRLSSPLWQEDNRTIAWMGFVNNATNGFDAYTLLPLNLFVRMDITGKNSSGWNVTGWFYDGKFYPTTEELRALVSSPEFSPPLANIDGNWTSTDPQGEPLEFDELPPPKLVSQGKRRFSLDEKEKYVEWMGFSFYSTLSKDTGLSLFDVQFKGERIIYELGLQEALTHYAGADPVVSGTTFLDTQAGFGAQVVPLVNGYDCPSYATYLNVSWDYLGATILEQANSICIFERETDYPLRRHTAHDGGSPPWYRYMSVTKNVQLVVRSAFSVGNYDFVLSYIFSLDGTIEVSVRASGYIQSAYFKGNEEYGFKIHDALSGSMHDHVLTFKADFDILGTKNSIQKVEFVPVTVEYPWAKGKPRNTMKVQKSFIENEADSSLTWATNDAALYAIVNKDTPNRFGEYRGYRIKSSGTIHLTVRDSTNLQNAGHFATSDLYITRQKDTEPRAAHGNNAFDTSNPLVDFSKFFDNESLEQEDLVVWFNLGMHHIPHTGDLPNTIFTTAHSSVLLEPLNYFEVNPASATRQQVRINYEEGGGEKIAEFNTFGTVAPTCSANLFELFPSVDNVFAS